MKRDNVFKVAMIIWAIAITFAVVPQNNAIAQTIKDRFKGILVENDADINGNLDVAGTSTLGDAVTVTTGDLTLSDGGLSLTDILNLDDTDSTLTGTNTITPTYSYIQVAPEEAVLTMTLSTGGASDGDLLIVHNFNTTNTVIVDTGAITGGGNITLGQNDVAGFIYGNSKWINLFFNNNS